MTIESFIPEMKQVMQQYFLLLNGKNKMKGDLLADPPNTYLLGNFHTIWANTTLGSELMIDLSQSPMPFISFDTLDYISYDKVNNIYMFWINNTIVGYVDSAGFHNGSP